MTKMIVSDDGWHCARSGQRNRAFQQNWGDKEGCGQRRIRSISPSPICSKNKIMSVLFLLTMMCLPRFGSAQRPRRLQQQQFQQMKIENAEEYEEILPASCIETGSDLLQAIRDFYQGTISSTYTSSAARTYGWPMDSWCVSSEVKQKLNSDDESPLRQYVFTAIEHVADIHDDDFLSVPDSDVMISHWILSASGSPCTDICSSIDTTVSFSNFKNSSSSLGEIAANQNNEEKDEATPGDDADSPNNTNNKEMDFSTSYSRGSRNKTTTAMLIRLIPVKLVCILSLMCLFLGVRQMFLSVERDNGACCCKFGCSLLGFGTGVYASYEGIDPSDVSDHQKVVEFELLQLAASGDEDDEVDIVIS